MRFIDRQLVCVACDRVFTFNKREQRHHFDHDLDDPRRCKRCRLERRRREADHEGDRQGAFRG